MKYYRDIFDLIHWDAKQIKSRVITHKEHYLRDAANDSGVILALPHTGNWDLAGAWCAIEIGTLSTVAERLRPEGVFEKFVAMRKAIGISILPLSGGGSTYEWLRSEALRGQIVPLLSDRDVAKNGSAVEFFGHQAKLPFGAALLAVDTKLPLITCATYYVDDVLHIDFDPPIYGPAEDLGNIERIRAAKVIQNQIATNLESHIAARPESWQMMSPIWPDLVVQES
jgi:KDO2-lipid IV(A) lauroyltransferase